ncbi:hypothetical protein SDC9_173731 [bioreactor metagenome]|uniref:Uncharacterized protein n=1 Tax=bioreactor metagenome TaxID=1076179 RepID=A0A645GH93_9ZZZZ
MVLKLSTSMKHKAPHRVSELVSISPMRFSIAFRLKIPVKASFSASFFNFLNSFLRLPSSMMFSTRFFITTGSKGFVKMSSAPSAYPLRAAIPGSSAVMSTTGSTSVIASSRICSRTSNPSISGITTSNSTAASIS